MNGLLFRLDFDEAKSPSPAFYARLSRAPCHPCGGGATAQNELAGPRPAMTPRYFDAPERPARRSWWCLMLIVLLSQKIVRVSLRGLGKTCFELLGGIMNHFQRGASRNRPFIGLRAFENHDREYFFGREDELDVLQPKVARNRFVAVVGASGCGKTSLMRAGLRSRFEEASDLDWHWVEVHPGNAPVRKLAAGLAGLTGETGDFAQAWADRLERLLTKSSFGISEALEMIPAARQPGSKVLLFVDQFEELFQLAAGQRDLDLLTAAERRDEATAFVRLILTAIKSPLVPIHIVVAIKSESIGDCGRFSGLAEAISHSMFLLPGMTRDQREVVIREPIRRAGGQVDPRFVQRALNDTNEDPGQLPVLQQALMTCWEHASRRGARKATARPHLTLEDYAKAGGVEQASRHAHEIFGKVSRQRLTRKPELVEP